MTRVLLRFLFVTLSVSVKCQYETPDKIQQVLSTDIVTLSNQGKYKESLELGIKMVSDSKKLGYLAGEGWAYYRVSNSYCNLEDFVNSDLYLTKAKEINIKLKDPQLSVAILTGLGRNYNDQNLSYSLAIKQFNSALKETEKIFPKQNRDKWRFYIYKNLISSYDNLQNADSTYYYAQKANNIKTDAYVLSSLTHYHMQYSRNGDSTLYYLKKSEKFLNKHPELKFEKAIIENQWGKYLLMKNEYSKALQHFLSAKKFAKESVSSSELLLSYSQLSKTYSILGDAKKSLQYKRKEISLQESLNQKLIKNLDQSFMRIVNHQETGNVNTDILLKIFIFFVAITFISGFILINRKIKMQKKLENFMANSEMEYLNTNRVIATLDDVIELAKNNSPNFYITFQEVYPQFHKKLVEIKPDISNSELEFCAFIFLGFQTKDIAENSFRSVKTIQNRKNKLRKRLEIKSEEDLYVWFKNLI